MKKVLITALLFAALTTQAQVWDELTRMDRLTHMGAGYTITAMTTAVAYNFTDHDWQAEMFGLFVGIVAAGAKEAYDTRTHEADMWDLGATVIGSVAAVVTFRVIIPDGRSKKQRLKVRLL